MATHIKAQMVYAEGVRLAVTDEEENEQGHAYLYVMSNDLHERPFGLLEDVFVEEQARGQGIGTQLVNKVIETAKNRNCYKLIGTTRHERPKVQEWYTKLGFEEHGKEYRMNL